MSTVASIFLHIARISVHFITPYDEVSKAMEDVSKVETLVRKFSKQRALCLVILTALLTTYIHQNKSSSACLSLGAILFVGRISFIYDEVNGDKFAIHVRSVGPYSYTLVMSLPDIIVQVMLLNEIFVLSNSKAFAVVMAISCYSPGLLLVIAIGMTTWMEGLRGEDIPY
ncbi:hypothetical protein BDQ17DRAFT_1411187 [Cyathus striatus]|nr:hypothetical protein BDQ17DRAFT_1411187 [Cyathus striatus]